MSRLFYVFDSDGNVVMDDRGYLSLEAAIAAASYLVLFVWPDPERASVGFGELERPTTHAYVEAREQSGSGPDGSTYSAEVMLETSTARAPRVPFVSYTQVGLDVLQRALPHPTWICRCGSSDVHATAWVDSANVVANEDGPLEGYFCNGCGLERDEVEVREAEPSGTI